MAANLEDFERREAPSFFVSYRIPLPNPSKSVKLCEIPKTALFFTAVASSNFWTSILILEKLNALECQLQVGSAQDPTKEASIIVGRLWKQLALWCSEFRFQWTLSSLVTSFAFITILYHSSSHKVFKGHALTDTQSCQMPHESSCVVSRAGQTVQHRRETLLDQRWGGRKDHLRTVSKCYEDGEELAEGTSVSQHLPTHPLLTQYQTSSGFLVRDREPQGLVC